MKKAACLWILFACTVLLCPAPGFPQGLDWIRSDGRKLVDSTGRQVILRGFVTLTNNQPDQPFVAYNMSHYLKMHDMGANIQSIRVFLGSVPTDGYIAQLVQMVQMAKALGMYTEFKTTLYGFDEFGSSPWTPMWQNQNGEQARIAQLSNAIWQQFLTEPAVVGYDLMNEPVFEDMEISGNVFVANYLLPFYQYMVGQLRAVDTQHLALFQPPIDPSSASTAQYTPFTSPFPVPPANGLYAPHFYVAITLSSFSDNAQAYVPLAQRYQQEATANGVPMFFGEYGVPWDPKNDARTDLETSYQSSEKLAAAIIDAYRLGYTRPWYSDDGAALARGRLDWAMVEGTGGLDADMRDFILDIVARPYPQRLAGTLGSFGFDFDNMIFQMQYTPDASKAVSVIYFPRKRHFTGGFYVVHSAGIVFTYDATQPNGLRVLRNTGSVDPTRFQWNDNRQVLQVTEWTSGTAATLAMGGPGAKSILP